MKFKPKTVICLIMSLLMAAVMTTGVFAADLDSLLEQADGLADYLNQLTIDMKTLSLQYDYIQAEIDEVETRITSNEILLQDAQTACDQQYEMMKKRIQYLYESGDTNYLSAILSSESISDILNKFEYIDSIVGYDRDMLSKYNDLIDTVKALQTDLVAKKADLEGLRSQAVANMVRAAAIDEAAEEKVVEYGVSEDEAEEVIQDYMDAYGYQIQAEIEGQIALAQLEDPDYSWYTDYSSFPQLLQESEIADALMEGYGWYDDSVYQVAEIETVAADTVTYEVADPEITTEQQYVAEEVITEPVQEEIVTEPIQEEIITEPVQEEIITEPVQEEIITEPVQEEIITEPVQEEIITEPVQDEIIETSDETYDKDSEAYLIACLVSGEAGYTSYETQVRIAQMVNNRIESEYFPDNAYDVLHQAGQFNIWDEEGNEIRTDTYFVENGPMETALEATYEVLNSESYDFPYLGAVTEDFYYNYPEYFTDTYGEVIDGGYYFNYNWW